MQTCLGKLYCRADTLCCLRPPGMRLRSVAALSLLFTYAFFFEYLPPFRWVDIPHDLEYWHYPLDDFAFQALRQGHIPEWDPTLVCGMTFAGNSQTAMFYPP